MIRPASTIVGAEDMPAPDALEPFEPVSTTQTGQATVDGIVARCSRITYDELLRLHHQWLQNDRRPWLDTTEVFSGTLGDNDPYGLNGRRIDLKARWEADVRRARLAMPTDVRPFYKTPDQKVPSKRCSSAEERAVSYGHVAVAEMLYATIMAETLTAAQWECLAAPWMAVLGAATETSDVKPRKAVHRRSGTRIRITHQTPEAAGLGVSGTLPGFRAAKARDVLDVLAQVLGEVDVSGIPDKLFARAQHLLATVGVEVQR